MLQSRTALHQGTFWRIYVSEYEKFKYRTKDFFIYWFNVYPKSTKWTDKFDKSIIYPHFVRTVFFLYIDYCLLTYLTIYTFRSIKFTNIYRWDIFLYNIPLKLNPGLVTMIDVIIIRCFLLISDVGMKDYPTNTPVLDRHWPDYDISKVQHWPNADLS